MHTAGDAVDGSPDTTLVFDAEGTVVYGAIDADGGSELVGREVPSLFAPTDAEAVEGLVARTLAGDSATVEASFDGDGKRRSVVVRAEPGTFDDEAAGHLHLRDGAPRARTVAALERLHAVSVDAELPFDQKIDRLLDVGCEHYDLDVGFLSAITDEFDVLEAVGDHERLQAGATAPLSETYCQRTVEMDEPLAVEDAADSPDVADEAYETFGLGCYVGATVPVDGETYGTLCFADEEPRERPFTDLDRTFLALAARWVGYEIAAELRRRELDETRERFEEFAGLLGHDLRNPLSVAVARLDYVRGQVDGEVDDEHLDAIEKGLDRIEGLIDDMLQFARLGERVSAPREVSMATVAEEAWNAVETHDATLEVAADAGSVSGDRSRLLTLLENLFRNAVEHGGSDVAVTVGATDDGFVVADDGPGIPPREREAVFEMGHTNREAGTGFGLATVKRIASAHGWSVAVTESEAGGARFEFDVDPSPV